MLPTNSESSTTLSHGGFQASVKTTCVLLNFMMMNRRGHAALRRVPEERSAALQDVARMGANNAAQ